ncbi:MAG: transglutaminase family protein [Pseudomonadota bacterium]
MRLKIHHTTTYCYEVPATYAIQTVRLSPRDFSGQYVCDWRLEINADCKLDTVFDAFGNETHSFSVDGPIQTLAITAIGEVETDDTNGLVTGTRERLPLALYLRETDLTESDEELIRFARTVADADETDSLSVLHALNSAVHETIRFDTSATETTTTAIEAFAARHGVCQDLSHIFIAGCRSLGIPARYVGGYMFRNDGENEQEAGHAWAEAFVQDVGWIAFDPAHGLCPTDAYVRVAAGLDYLSAAPIRGVRYGGAGETLDVSLRIEDINAEPVVS